MHSDLFRLDSQVAVVTGGSGVLGSAMARGLAAAGAKVAVLGRRRDRLDEVVASITAAGGTAVALAADVLVRRDLEAARSSILGTWGRIDILVNAAGGNVPAATLDASGSFFDVPEDGFRRAMQLNFEGTVLPSQVFGAEIARYEGDAPGSIVTISSMAADRAITRVPAYAAAKAAVENLTRWLAVDLSSRQPRSVRVNAIAPGFFIADQNRRMLTTETGGLTPRGQTIIDRTPMHRFGNPEDLVGTLVWLCSPGARFVTGIVVPVDGGFSAFSGV
jgi:NAD(P)-dependent dehydrogenase (short-subunit alcohol dehydrogenase family)